MLPTIPIMRQLIPVGIVRGFAIIFTGLLDIPSAAFLVFCRKTKQVENMTGSAQ